MHAHQQTAATATTTGGDRGSLPARAGRLDTVPLWARDVVPDGLDVEIEQGSPEPIERNALAVTTGSHVRLAHDAPGGDDGRRLVLHELAHVIQQTAPDAGLRSAAPVSPRRAEAEADHAAAAVLAGRPMPSLSRAALAPARQARPAVAGPPNRVTQYPGSRGGTHRLGEAAGLNLLVAIDQNPDGSVQFQWWNFPSSRRIQGTVNEWETIQVVAGAVGITGAGSVQAAITQQQWAAMPDDVTTELFRLHEARQITLPDTVVVAGYQGMVYAQAIQSLQDNETQIDALIGSGRVDHFAEYARGLKEASIVRDALVARRNELNHSLVQQHSFTFGMAGNTMNMDPYRRMQIFRELGPVEQALSFWLAAFPLLKRFETAEITPDHVGAAFQGIKANIISTRAQLLLAPSGHGDIDLMDLANTRSIVNARLGTRATATVQQEDERRRRAALAESGALFVLGIALLFLPGGIFIDAAIGLAMGVHAYMGMLEVGHAANTSIDPDAGLMTQAQLLGAEIGVVLAVIGAAVGAGAAGLRILRGVRMLTNVRAVGAELTAAEQINLARLALRQPALVAGARTMAEMRQLLTSAGSTLTFEQTAAMRALSRRLAGLPPKSLSAESLDTFLARVWRQRTQAMARGGVYRLYSAAAEANPMARTQQAVLHDLGEIARGRPRALSILQSTGDSVQALHVAGELTPARAGNTFMHFIRAGANPATITRRIYLNLAADEAPGVMRSIVREVVDNPAHFPGVYEAKIAGPAMLSRRAESVVIYAENEAAANNVLRWVRSQQASAPKAFLDSAPPMTNQVMRGVGEAAEPLVSGTSFGEVRATAIQRALAETAAAGDEQAFLNRAMQLLQQAGVDTANPAANLP